MGIVGILVVFEFIDRLMIVLRGYIMNKVIWIFVVVVVGISFFFGCVNMSEI